MEELETEGSCEIHKIYNTHKTNEMRENCIQKAVHRDYLGLYKYILMNSDINLPVVYELKEADDSSIVIEEYIEGRTLSDMLHHNEISENQLVDIICQLCDVCEYLYHMNPPLYLNKINLGKVVVLEDNLIKIMDYESFGSSGAVQEDISYLCGIMNSVSSRFIKKYRNVIKKGDGTYQYMQELYKDLIYNDRNRKIRLFQVFMSIALLIRALTRLLK